MSRTRTKKRHSSRRASKPSGWHIFSPQTRFWMLAAFIACAFLMGGSARPDTQSLILLRPIAILMGAYALIAITREQWANIKWPAIMLGMLGVVIALQLIPLSPDNWGSLPMRGAIAEIGRVFGIEEIWRPVSLAPERTLNALFSLVVPAAALVLFAVQERYNYRSVLLVLICAAIASAALGIAQLSGPSEGVLYTYRITNNGSAVGLLANRNHQAVFLAVTAYMAVWFALTELKREWPRPIRLALCGAAVLLGVVVVLVIGSRAGLAALAIAGAASIYQAWKAGLFKAKPGRKSLPDIYRKGLMALALLLIAIVIFVIFQSRSLSIDRMFDTIGDSSTTDLRASLAPVLWQMMIDFMPFGSGFGSFEDVYRLYEPFEALTPRYVNQAHNDWAQFIIEGGLAGLALMFAFIFWFVRRLMQSRSAAIHSTQRDRAALAGVVLIVLGMASIVDYPLRTPALAAYAAVLIAIIESSVRSQIGTQKQSNSRPEDKTD